MATGLKDIKAKATAAHQKGDRAAAARLYASYLARAPKDAGAWSNLGALHRSEGRHDLALLAHKRAIALAPNEPGFKINYANVLSDTGDYAASIALRREVLELRPDDPDQLAMVGRCLRGQGAYADAIAHLSEARAILPDDAEIRLQLAFAQLGQGDYGEAFQNYRARWELGELKPRRLQSPEWDGGPLRGRKLLVLPEQGFGDFILFSRFLGRLSDLDGEVFVLVEAPLQRLMRPMPNVTFVDGKAAAEIGIDVWMNAIDLAQAHFEEDAEVPPPAQLQVPDEARARARQRIEPHRDLFRIGVVWSGSVTYKGNAFRSFSHRQFLPLAEVPGVQLFSLYKGPLLEQFHEDAIEPLIIDLGRSDSDFADCAANMLEMDLIVTSDTATAHIAGSLGLDVWTVLHWDPFWVWRHDGARTAWYPSMRLFRQPRPGDWAGAFDKVVSEVKGIVEARV